MSDCIRVEQSTFNLKLGRLVGEGENSRAYLVVLTLEFLALSNGQGKTIRDDFEERGWSEGIYPVVKINKGELTEDRIDEIRNEVVVLKRLSHPNIQTLYGCITTRDNVWIFSENAGSNTLYSIINESGMSQISGTGMRGKIIKSLISAVKYMHSNKVIHGDLHPKNIIVNGDKPTIIDYGLACSMDDGMKPMLRCKHYSGNAQFKAPHIDYFTKMNFTKYKFNDYWALIMIILSLYQKLTDFLVLPFRGVKISAAVPHRDKFISFFDDYERNGAETIAYIELLKTLELSEDLDLEPQRSQRSQQATLPEITYGTAALPAPLPSSQTPHTREQLTDKCKNSEDLNFVSWDEYKDEELEKVFKTHSGRCYNTDNLCDSFTTNGYANRSLFNEDNEWSNNPIWIERDLPVLLKRIKKPDCRDALERNLNIRLETRAHYEMLNLVAELGWVAKADHSAKLSKGFPIFESILEKFWQKFSIYTEAERNMLLDLTFNGFSLAHKLEPKAMARECIHGVGYWLMGFYLYYYNKFFATTTGYPLNPIFKRRGDNSYDIFLLHHQSNRVFVLLNLSLRGDKLIIKDYGDWYKSVFDSEYAGHYVKPVYQHMIHIYGLNIFTLEKQPDKNVILLLQGADDGRVFDTLGDAGLIKAAQDLKDFETIYTNFTNLYELAYISAVLQQRTIAHLIIMSHGTNTELHISARAPIHMDSISFAHLTDFMNRHLLPSASVFLHGCLLGKGGLEANNFANKLRKALKNNNAVFASTKIVNRGDLLVTKFLKKGNIVDANYEVAAQRKQTRQRQQGQALEPYEILKFEPLSTHQNTQARLATIRRRPVQQIRQRAKAQQSGQKVMSYQQLSKRFAAIRKK